MKTISIALLFSGLVDSERSLKPSIESTKREGPCDDALFSAPSGTL